MFKCITFILSCLLFSLSNANANEPTVKPGDINRAQLTTLVESKQDFLLLDVRSAEEFQTAHIPGAVNIDHTALAKKLSEIKDYQDKTVVVYCRSGRRAGLAIDVLKANGFKKTVHLEGDMLGWQAANMPHKTH